MKQETRDVRIKRLLYQSWYRGCKETDKILGRFARAHIEALSADDLDLFEQLMNEDDHDIFAWITGKQPIPTEYKSTPLWKKIAAFDFSAPQE
ncbi:MAG: succinate dehydrogenase assembly factor 2 [Proteobacteria bacterium]|nr:succinate dehydrogenase assembly factor 2 [Pseudomonadota bacterium]